MFCIKNRSHLSDEQARLHEKGRHKFWSASEVPTVSYCLWRHIWMNCSQRLFPCLLLPEKECKLIYSLKIIRGRPLNQNLVPFTCLIYSLQGFLSSGVRIINCFHYETFPSASTFRLFSKKCHSKRQQLFRSLSSQRRMNLVSAVFGKALLFTTRIYASWTKANLLQTDLLSMLRFRCHELKSFKQVSY